MFLTMWQLKQERAELAFWMILKNTGQYWAILDIIWHFYIILEYTKIKDHFYLKISYKFVSCDYAIISERGRIITHTRITLKFLYQNEIDSLLLSFHFLKQVFFPMSTSWIKFTSIIKCGTFRLKHNQVFFCVAKPACLCGVVKNWSILD